jgi:hypothetical protein
MKYCPTCNQRFTEGWLSFCPSDGSVLSESEVSPANPGAQATTPETPSPAQASERATLNLPRGPVAGSWAMLDEHQPVQPLVWRPPPAPVTSQPPSQALALASMITALAGWVVGCFGPLPGIAAIIMGLMALSQIKRWPERVGGKPLAWIGVAVGGVSVLAYLGLIAYFIVLFASANH